MLPSEAPSGASGGAVQRLRQGVNLNRRQNHHQQQHPLLPSPTSAASVATSPASGVVMDVTTKPHPPPRLPSLLAPIRCTTPTGLRDNITVSYGGRHGVGAHVSRTVAELRVQNVSLQQRVAQLEHELRLALQGSRGGRGESSGPVDLQRIVTEANRTRKFERGSCSSGGGNLDLDLIQRNIEVLNRLTSETAGLVVSNTATNNNNVRVLRPSAAVELHFYHNGVHVADPNAGESGSFFLAYASAAAEAFLTDLLQGYFPAEFRSRYPTGLKLRLLDHSDEAWVAPATVPTPPPTTTSALMEVAFPPSGYTRPLTLEQCPTLCTLKVRLPATLLLLQVTSPQALVADVHTRLLEVLQQQPQLLLQGGGVPPTAVGEFDLWVACPPKRAARVSPLQTLEQAGLAPNGVVLYRPTTATSRDETPR